MPIYERRCSGCGAVFSHLSKVDDRTKAKACPGCGSYDTQPIMSATQTNFTFADKSARKERR